MRRFCSTLVLLVAAVAALGFYQGWFQVSATENSLTDRVDVNLHIDKHKIKYDARKAREIAGNLRGDFEKWLDEPDATPADADR
jgi:cell division protein FtsX